MYRHQGQGFAINRSARKKGRRDRLKGGLTRVVKVVKIRKVQIKGLCQNFLWLTVLAFNAHVHKLN